MSAPAKRARTASGAAPRITTVTQAGNALVVEPVGVDDGAGMGEDFFNCAAELLDRAPVGDEIVASLNFGAAPSGVANVSVDAVAAGAGSGTGSGTGSGAAGAASAAPSCALAALAAASAAAAAPAAPDSISRCKAGAYRIVFSNVAPLAGHSHVVVRPLMEEDHVLRLAAMAGVMRAVQKFNLVNTLVLDAGDDGRLRSMALLQGDPKLKLNLFKVAVVDLTRKVVESKPYMDDVWWGMEFPRTALQMVADKEAKRLSKDSFSVNLVSVDFYKFFKTRSWSTELILENYGPHLQLLFNNSMERLQGGA